MNEHSPEQLLQRIDTRRAEGKRLAQILRLEGTETLPRDGKLTESIKSLLEKRLYVVVDKKLGLVFGVEKDFITAILADLYRYHQAESGKPVEQIRDTSAHDRYIDSGMGYYFHATASRFVTDSVAQAGEAYVPDKDDEKVFGQHGVYRYPRSK